jgi:hypothetical protein
LTARIPTQVHTDAFVGRFDDGVLADGQPDFLARLDEEVAEIVVARQPDAALNDRQFAAEAPEAHGFAEAQVLVAAVERGPSRVRIHHQSPVLRVGIIGLPAGGIQ